MKKKLLSIILMATLATSTLGAGAAVTTSAAEVNVSSVSAGQFRVSTPMFSNIENSDGQVNLSWNDVDGAYKYRVYYKGRNGWTRFAETTGTTAVDDVVKSGVTYTYTVRALDKNNNFVSDFNHSGWHHMYVSNPKFNKIENTDGQVNLSWNKVDGAYKYRVYYKGRNGWTKFAETTGTTAIDDIVKSGTTYTYTVRALDKNNNFVSDFNHSGWKHMYVSNPKFSNIENTDGQVNLSWKAVDGAYKYRVYYKGRNGWTRFAETTGTNAIDDVVKSGTTYTYTVRALDKNNNFVSDFSHSGWKHMYVATPKISNLENTIEGIKISWDKVDGADCYRVFYRGKNGWKRLETTSGTSVVDTDVEAGTTYTYTVRAVDSNDNYVSDYVSSGWKIKRLEWHEAIYEEVYHPAVTETIEHPAVIEKVKIVDEEAYTYEEPVYEYKVRTICNGCGADITGNVKSHMFAGCKCNYHAEKIKVQTGTKTVTVPEQSHYETKVVKEAWNETVVVKEAWTEKILIKEAGWY